MFPLFFQKKGELFMNIFIKILASVIIIVNVFVMLFVGVALHEIHKKNPEKGNMVPVSLIIYVPCVLGILLAIFSII